MYYRIVDKNNCSPFVPEEFAVQYEINKWVEAKDDMKKQGFNLFVYTNKEAIPFLLWYFNNKYGNIFDKSFSIYECEVENIISFPSKLIDMQEYIKSHIIKYVTNLSFADIDILMVEKVKLTKRFKEL